MNEQPIENEQALAEEERKKSLKTNKKIVLDEEPVVFKTPFVNDDEPIQNVAQPAAPVMNQPAQQELPQEQSGNITF